MPEAFVILGYGHTLAYDAQEASCPSLASPADWLWSYAANTEALEWLRAARSTAVEPREPEDSESAYHDEFGELFFRTRAGRVTEGPASMQLAPWHLRFAQVHSIALPAVSEGRCVEEDRLRFLAALREALAAERCVLYRVYSSDEPYLFGITESIREGDVLTVSSTDIGADWDQRLRDFQQKLGLELVEAPPCWRAFSGVYR